MSWTFGEVCAGVSGLGSGFERAGFTCSWQIEIDKSCQSVLRHRYPHSKLYDDATKEGRANLARVRAILGGTPCQGFSIAGLRKGLADDRSNLCLHFVRICDELQPDVIVWENVPGVLNLEDNAFGCFLAGLAGLDTALVHPRTEHFANYWRADHCVWPAAGVVAGPSRTVAWRVLDSQYFGVAQRRDRVFVVACPHQLGGSLGERELQNGRGLHGLAAKILFESESMRRHSPPSRQTREDVAATLGAGTPGCGPRTDTDRMTFVPTHDIAQGIHRRGRKGPDSDCTTTLAVSPLTTRPYSDTLSHESKLIPLDLAPTLLAGNGTHGNNPLDVPLTVMGFEKGRGESTGDIAGTLRANCGASEGVNDGKADNQCVAFNPTQLTHPENRSNPQHNDPCPSLAATASAPCVAFQPGGITRGKGTAPTIEHVPPLMAENDGDTRQCVAFHTQQDPINSNDQAPCIGVGGRGQASAAVAYNLHPVHSNAMNSPGPGNAAIPTETARSLDTGGVTVNQGGTVAVQGPQVRRLVPVECERVQGFPDDWTRHGLKGGKIIQQKDSPRYRQLGNAVTSVVAEWLAVRIKTYG